MVARNVAKKISDALGQAELVDNRAGASGNIGADAAARAPADGHTLFVTSSGALAANMEDAFRSAGCAGDRLALACRTHTARPAGQYRMNFDVIILGAGTAGAQPPGPVILQCQPGGQVRLHGAVEQRAVRR